MIDKMALAACLHSIGVSEWTHVLPALLDERLSSRAHGSFDRWRSVVASLEDKKDKPGQLRKALLELAPWRKGPFHIESVHIDSEWRSDLKWGRLEHGIAPIEGHNVLDVGCGNGYYALKMREAGAAAVVGIDPTLLYVMQFLAVNVFRRQSGVFVLPLRLAELPLPAGYFDTTFSMGVLYHQRAPVDHLRQLRQTLRPNGQLVLETIYLPGNDCYATTPKDRYARMRNVWLLPTLSELKIWLYRCGYENIEIIDRSVTTVDEQRATEWMAFDSLREALNPDDPTKTIEGWPAPHRVVITATSP